MIDSFYNNLIVEDRYRMILDGLQVTLLITVCAAVLGTLLGGLVCWMRMSRRRWLQRTAKVYIEIMRGTPVLVLLMLQNPWHIARGSRLASSRPGHSPTKPHSDTDFQAAFLPVSEKGIAYRWANTGWS